ncbi:MAG: type III-A CRISPR-associated RAMP protein Csm4 [Desulfomonilaceae bacterium]
MSDYRDYRLDVKLLSPVGTPWQSDTIMGHLAWCVGLRDGESSLKAFLEPFLEADPLFVVSDGFPSGLLPRPFFPLVQERGEMSIEQSALAKKRTEAPLLSTEDFEAVRRGMGDLCAPVDSPWRTFEMLHAVIDRTTFSTEGQGNIYTTSSQALDLKSSVISVYVRAKEQAAESIKDLFEYLSSIGFGRDKSTGSGEFRVVGFSECDLFALFPNADGFISLSTFVPGSSDPTEGFWKLHVKRGKLGEGTGQGNPFKRPLIQFLPGSAFFTDGMPAPWYGRVVERIAPGMTEAVQICYCFAVPCGIPALT